MWSFVGLEGFLGREVTEVLIFFFVLSINWWGIYLRWLLGEDLKVF